MTTKRMRTLLMMTGPMTLHGRLPGGDEGYLRAILPHTRCHGAQLIWEWVSTPECLHRSPVGDVGQTLQSVLTRSGLQQWLWHKYRSAMRDFSFPILWLFIVLYFPFYFLMNFNVLTFLSCFDLSWGLLLDVLACFISLGSLPMYVSFFTYVLFWTPNWG